MNVRFSDRVIITGADTASDLEALLKHAAVIIEDHVKAGLLPEDNRIEIEFKLGRSAE